MAGKQFVDWHYTQAGFFDIHVCNWPGREPFYLVLFSTTCFKEIESISVTDAEGEPLTTLGMYRDRVIKHKHEAEKRVFMLHVPLPEKPEDGWLEAQITAGQRRKNAGARLCRAWPAWSCEGDIAS